MAAPHWTARASAPPSPLALRDPDTSRFYVESLTVYPIKSCGGWRVPYDTPWDVHSEGLAWDREWCLVHRATGEVLSQKRHPKMALIKPTLDFGAGKMVIACNAANKMTELSVPLSQDPSWYHGQDKQEGQLVQVCGDQVQMRVYDSLLLQSFFSELLETPCQLARFPASASASRPFTEGHAPTRHVKPHLQSALSDSLPQSLLLSNESPILIINRASFAKLSQQLPVSSITEAVFRANIILQPKTSLDERDSVSPADQQPYAEDAWSSIRILRQTGTDSFLDVLGPCRRCQMVCIDPTTAERRSEPFSTLAKTRRRDGKVWFGVHCALNSAHAKRSASSIAVGDRVVPSGAVRV